MLNSWICIAVLAFCPCLVSSVWECWNTATSEGYWDLQHGQSACDALQVGETNADKGNRFVICSYGNVYKESCSSGLRYDVVTNACTWPPEASCRLGNQSTESTTANPTTSTPLPSGPSSTNTTQSSNGSSTVPLPTEPSLTGACNPTTCRLPNCSCFGARPNIPLSDTPMFITLTFDDAVTPTVYNNFFKPLLVDNVHSIRNPNGCGMNAAFYINHEYTDYEFVLTLAELGNEIASHTVSHSLPPGESSADYPLAVAEIAGVREKVYDGTGSQSISDAIVGFRAPYLRVAHDVQFDALINNGFLYDTSITNVEIFSGRKPLWPFTLDYVMPRCPNVPCPTKPYRGLWEFPINGLMGSDNYTCGMLDTCSVGSNVFTATSDEWKSFFNKNFQSYFYPDRIPMHMFTHGSMFLRSPPSYPALVSWFQDLQLTYSNVWFVSPKMVIEWMQNPITNSQMKAQKWGCVKPL